MPSAWMPEALHDTRMKAAWPAIIRREMERRIRAQGMRARKAPVRRPLARPLHGAHA